MKKKSVFYFFLGFATSILIVPMLEKSDHPAIEAMRTFISGDPVILVILLILVLVSVRLITESGFLKRRKTDEADEESKHE
ncbi:hypothetical protein ACHAL6_05855 [Proteiniclasticum sp. C24MP]|uniref:hypothetical protein n=1 Tax=Proteiniclasticum sp. C24MP TaxID=3374101 RepID=UPI0037553B5D